MKILILRSERRPRSNRRKDAYTQEFTSAFAEKVIGNLSGEPDFCSACGQDCTGCRKTYDRRFGREIAGVISLPAVLPYLLENPESHVPRHIPQHDVILAINVHEQILIEILKRCCGRGTRGVVAPIESPRWLSPAGQAEANAICGSASVEASFPKPFCSFDPPASSVLAEFRRRFHIGKPQVELTLKEQTIERACVHVSAACGATYYVARWLAGKNLHDDLKYEVIAKRLHSYPCTASMEWDDEIGDTIMHVASRAHYEILSPLTGRPADEPEMMLSPSGRMLPRPMPARDSAKNIERAKEAILEDLASGQSASVQTLKSRCRVSPAAIHSALLILKQEGKIRTEGGRIFKA